MVSGAYDESALGDVGKITTASERHMTLSRSVEQVTRTGGCSSLESGQPLFVPVPDRFDQWGPSFCTVGEQAS
jgi:hypothetical protein